jgi:hypothetical protein
MGVGDEHPFGPVDDVSVWRAMPVAACVSQGSCSCERIANSNVRQPLAMGAHVGYVLVGFYAIVDPLLPGLSQNSHAGPPGSPRGVWRGRDLTVSSVYAWLWGWSCLATGVAGGPREGSGLGLGPREGWDLGGRERERRGG